MKKTTLDKEEQEIVDSFENGEWKPVRNQKKAIAQHKGYAANTLSKHLRAKICLTKNKEAR
ncbi:MAG: hypothetical protein NTX50_18170 [Candidatus Sumerlaeota bacterium]|nr:hypothetical protein [Candidatus Sumerlaeota bacterium]